MPDIRGTLRAVAMPDAWQQATENFSQYLPPGVTEWIILAEAGAHANVIRSLRGRLAITEVVTLGVDSPEFMAAVAEQHSAQPYVGLLDFALADAEVRYDGLYLPALRRFAAWPALRHRRCTDVWDLNFAPLFAEPSADLTRRCYGTAAKLRGHEILRYTAPDQKSRLELSCDTAGWIVYSAVEAYDNTLPSGEVTCRPRSVDGDVEIDGWIVGTSPVAPKFGRICGGELGLSFCHGEVVAVYGDRSDLRADVERMLNSEPPLGTVTQLSVGQSRAARTVKDLHPRACRWHEKVLGLHLGLGGKRAQTSSSESRATLVFAHGTLTTGSGEPIMSW